MMIARWHVEAKFGHKQEAVDTIRRWAEEIGPTIGFPADRHRVVTGSIGVCESLIEVETQIENLTELDEVWRKMAANPAHVQWGKDLAEHIVSGSNHWEVFRVV